MPKVLKYYKDGYPFRAIDESWLINKLIDHIAANNEIIDAMYASYPEEDFEEGSLLLEQVENLRADSQWCESLIQTISELGPETLCTLD